MARLPQVPRRGVTLQAPSSRASGATIATPYQIMAEALGSIGQTVQSAATAKASSQGQNAVERDGAGNLTVRFMSNLTEVGRNYNRAASQAYLARLSNDMRTQAQQFAIQANGDVDFFQEAWVGYQTGILDLAPEPTQGAVLAMLEEVGAVQYRAISNQRYESDIAKFGSTLRAEMAYLESQLLTLASQGGAGTPEFDAMLAQRRDIGVELGGNHAFNTSVEAERWATDRLEAELVIEATRWQVLQQYPLDPVGGMARATEIINDPELALSPSERLAGLASIDRAYEATTSEYRVRRDALTAEVDDAVYVLERGLPFDFRNIADLWTRADELNAFDDIARLEVAARQHDLIADLDAATPGARLEHWQNTAAWASGQTQSFLTAHGTGLTVEGLNPAFGARLAAAIDAAEAATGETAQINSLVRSNERQAQLYADFTQEPVTFNGVTYQPGSPVGLAAPPGQSRHNSGTAADIGAGAVLDWLHEHAAEFGLEFLPGNAFTVDPGHIQMSGDAPAAFVVAPEALEEIQGLIRQDLSLLLDRNDAVLDRNWGLNPASAEFLRDLALAADDPALTQRAVAQFYRSVGADAVGGGLTFAEAEGYAAQLAAGAVTGDKFIAANIDRGMTARASHLQELRATNPALEGQERQLYTLEPIDFSNAETMAPGLVLREAQLAILSQSQGIGQQPLLQPEEAILFGRTLAAAPMDQAIAIISGMQNALTPEAMTAVLGQLVDEAPELAIAASYMAQGGSDEVLRRLLAEQRLAQDPAYRPPSQTVTAAPFVAEVYGAAFSDLPAHQGRLDGIAWTLFINMARERGIATDLVSDASQELFRSALQLAAGATYPGSVQHGGVTTVNGHAIVVPIGMRVDQVEPLLQSLTEADLQRLGAPISGNGVAVDAADIRNARLVAVGDGIYRVARGIDDGGAPRFFATADGEYWLLDLNALQKAKGRTIFDAIGDAAAGPAGDVAAWMARARQELGPPPQAVGELTWAYIEGLARVTEQSTNDIIRQLATIFDVPLDEIIDQVRPVMQ